MSVYFHGTFGLHREHMARILQMALEHPDWTDAQFAEPFGYMAPFAAKMRTWLHKTGIADLRLPLALTDFGEIVYRNDKSLKKTQTLWYMHQTLIGSPHGAENWHFFFQEFLPAHSTFTREDLLDALAIKLKPHSEVHFGRDKPMTKTIARKLIECYTLNEALGELRLLEVMPDGNYRYRADNQRNSSWSSPKQLDAAYSDT